MKFPLSSMPQAPLQWQSQSLFVIRFKTNLILYGKLKSAVDDDPSAGSISVVVPEYFPPRRRTEPFWSCQQRCSTLCSLKVTDKAVNVPAPSNRKQDFGEFLPPQARFPHKDRPSVATGMSLILQLRPDLGLKISTVLTEPPSTPPYPVTPPTVRIPACKHSVVIS